MTSASIHLSGSGHVEANASTDSGSGSMRDKPGLPTSKFISLSGKRGKGNGEAASEVVGTQQSRSDGFKGKKGKENKVL
ncbi:hypothetical protein REPUB_Repub07fG0080800 [Reevesia pubescens]